MINNPGFWQGRRVLITGHTGFKGSWLAVWLKHLGAHVSGFALNPGTSPSLFDVAGVARCLEHDLRGDINNLEELRQGLTDVQPETIFHLAAQSLVRESYREPLLTWMTNCLGTAHVLECMRTLPSVRATVLVTTDKVYENDERGRAFNEDDALGSSDPYSSSKAAAELVADSYRAGFFRNRNQSNAAIATARSGNVIGGGDWADERLVPDCLRAFAAGRPVHLRNPESVRPWQHVLEPLSGYMMLAESLLSEEARSSAASWNFGPGLSDEWPVLQVAKAVARAWGEGAEVVVDTRSEQPQEAGLLRLDSGRARTRLGWRPRWALEQAINMTVAWDRAWRSGADAYTQMIGQIESYMS